jgi:hypothetical protein
MLRRVWGLVFATAVAGCTTDASGAGSHVHIGCEAGAGCAEDTTVQGVCAQDRPHLCFCTPGTSTPSADCLANEVKPYPPYTRALCCP